MTASSSTRSPREISSTTRAHAIGDPGPIERTLEEVEEIERRDRERTSWSDRLADRITTFSGSMLFFYLNAAWFAIWIPLNLGWFGIEPFDPFPFGLLTMVVSLEAIFLATFVLISQNRQATLADKRAKVDLQVDLLAEEEVTAMMNLILEIHDHLGLSHHNDPEIEQLRERTDLNTVLDEIDRRDDGEDADRPDGASKAATPTAH
jgi:uncharacterized membrane protein